MISEALAAIVRSNDEPVSKPPGPACCGKKSGTGSELPSPPNRLNRVCAAAGALLTKVNVVIQFSSAARWGIEPMKLKPGMEEASCSTVYGIPAIVKWAARSAPGLDAT